MFLNYYIYYYIFFNITIIPKNPEEIIFPLTQLVSTGHKSDSIEVAKHIIDLSSNSLFKQETQKSLGQTVHCPTYINKS